MICSALAGQIIPRIHLNRSAPDAGVIAGDGELDRLVCRDAGQAVGGVAVQQLCEVAGLREPKGRPQVAVGSVERNQKVI